ncbi:MAG: hypothetical protein QOG20_3808 [Pseudonocardiales bacterium]|jgi:AcrR family transcriptional regulator|nr:hypothetical protein [Pseudonocardiales bacterium]
MISQPSSSLLARALAVEPADAIGERILDAALEQFGRTGITRSTMEDVARRAGTARVTVYRRFPTKQTLVEAVLLRECLRCLLTLDDAIAGLPALDDRIVEGFRVALGYARAHPLVGGLLEVEPQTILPFLTLHAGPATAAIREYLAGHLRAADGGSGSDTDVVAELMVRIAVSFVTAPEGCVPLRTDEEIRGFARRYLVPLAG